MEFVIKVGTNPGLQPRHWLGFEVFNDIFLSTSASTPCWDSNMYPGLQPRHLLGFKNFNDIFLRHHIFIEAMIDENFFFKKSKFMRARRVKAILFYTITDQQIAY